MGWIWRGRQGLDQGGFWGAMGRSLNYVAVVMGSCHSAEGVTDRICFCCFLQVCLVDPWRMS